MKSFEYLKLLDSEIGISGNEDGVRGVVRDFFKKYCDEIKTDKLGNLIGKISGTNPDAPSVMIEAHMDEIGLMVSKITDEGSLKFITVGGFDPKVLTGSEVTVFGKEKLFGVIGATPPHLLKGKSEAPSFDELCVDIGFFSKEETEKKVSVGDVISINTFFTPLLGDMVSGRCIDDRGCLAIIFLVMEAISKYKIQNDIYFVAAVQEELGLRGARVSSFWVKPDISIVLDVCHGESPGVTEDAFPCGKGPVITLGPNLHTKLTKKLIAIAKDNGIDIQKEACASSTGTDAWEIQVSGLGVKTALVSVPLRYMHSNYEVCSLKDIESAAELISMFLINLKAGEDL